MSALSLRYARAFAQVVLSSQANSDQAQEQLHDFAAMVGDSRQLREVLLNPSIPMDQKVKVIDAIGGRVGLLPQVRNFIAVIVAHQRLDVLSEILQEYSALADVQAGVAEAEVTTARALDDAGRAELEGSIAQLAGTRVRTTYSVDPSLLGGAVVRIGSTVHDGSVRAQLDQMKEALTSAALA